MPSMKGTWGVGIEEQPEAREMDRWDPAVSSVTRDWERGLCRAPWVGRVRDLCVLGEAVSISGGRGVEGMTRQDQIL